MFHLIIAADFADYRRGDRVEDQATIAKILAGENENKVVKVAAPEPAPTSRKADKAE